MARAEVKSPKIFMPDPYQQLIDDLVAEQRYLDATARSTFTDEVWQNDTPCRGWMVRDVIAHLAEVDESATAEWPAGTSQTMSGGDRSEDGTRSALQDSSRHMTRTQLVDWWRAARVIGWKSHSVPATAAIGLPWAGPPMSARSFATARLMECWSHGLDALDGAGHRGGSLGSASAHRPSRLHHPPVRLSDERHGTKRRAAAHRTEIAVRRVLVPRRRGCAERDLRHSG